jgi:hypothetical protein
MSIETIKAALQERGEDELAASLEAVTARHWNGASSAKPTDPNKMRAPTKDEESYARKRLKGIIDQYRATESAVTRAINLRTDQCLNTAELNAWIYVLTDENWHNCAGYAAKKLAQMGKKPYNL